MATKKNKTLIVDANNMAARFAHSYDLMTSDNLLSGVVYGVFEFLLRFMPSRKHRIHRVVFAFDSYPKFRYDMYPEYKGKRKETRAKSRDAEEYYADYQEQLEYLKVVLPKINCIPLLLPDFEADDAVYKIIKSMPDEEFLIYSSDRDFIQMVNPRVTMAKPRHRKSFETYIDKKPRYYLIRRALIGDTSDSIKGVPQIGEKRADEIVEAVGESKISKFLNNIDRAGKYADRLREHKGIIYRNFKLMSLSYAYKKFTVGLRCVYIKSRFSPVGFRDTCKRFELRSASLDSENYERLLTPLIGDLPDTSDFRPVRTLV